MSVDLYLRDLGILLKEKALEAKETDLMAV